jgi:nitroreductase
MSGFSVEVLEMDVREAIATRFSCRAFLDKPVALAIVQDILERAAHAPSGGNLQPWRTYALAGARLEQLIGLIRPRFGELPIGEGTEYAIYPKDMKEPYRSRTRSVGELLYGALGIPREDRAARYRQFARNFDFFGAPVGLLFSIDRTMGAPQWADLGMYIQTVMLAARAHGLHCCAQESWAHWHKTVGAFLQLPAEHMLFCGMALGYGDPDAPINGWRSPREPLAAHAAFLGFEAGHEPEKQKPVLQTDHA